jgi:hypothetical protein
MNHNCWSRHYGDPDKCSACEVAMLERRATPEFSAAVLETALGYARLGMAVVPLHTPISRPGITTCTCRACKVKAGKHPRIRTDASPTFFATTDESVIRQWWEWWPSANVGIAMGLRHGVLGLDFDVRHGEIPELEAVIGPLSSIGTVRTSTFRGFHAYFRHPGVAVGNYNGVFPGVDVRDDDSFLVAPPSLHSSGAEYRWSPGCAPGERELSELPDGLLRAVLERTARMTPYAC